MIMARLMSRNLLPIILRKDTGWEKCRISQRRLNPPLITLSARIAAVIIATTPSKAVTPAVVPYRVRASYPAGMPCICIIEVMP